MGNTQIGTYYELEDLRRSIHESFEPPDDRQLRLIGGGPASSREGLATVLSRGSADGETVVRLLNEDSKSDDDDDDDDDQEAGPQEGAEEGSFQGPRDQQRRRHGSGTLTYRADDPRGRNKYAGEFRHGRREGKGRLTWKNGSEYRGEWLGDRMHGHGVLTMPSGLRYSGDWKCDCFHGSGSLVWPSGRRYDGAWAANRQHGMGILVYEATDRRQREVYSGEWALGQRHGQGMMRWRGGSFYQGGWLQGKRCGYGEQSFEGGSSFCGQWRNGKRNGPGRKMTSISTTFVASWVNDKKEGLSAYLFPHGRVEHQFWASGRIVPSHPLPPNVQRLLVLCIEAVAAHAPVRNAVIESLGTPHQALPSDVIGHLIWVWNHLIVARQRSVSLWERISQKYAELSAPYL